MWTYKGAGGMPEVPGAPMRDITNDEHESLCERLGAAALCGVYEQATEKPKAKVKPSPKVETEEAEQI